MGIIWMDDKYWDFILILVLIGAVSWAVFADVEPRLERLETEVLELTNKLDAEIWYDRQKALAEKSQEEWEKVE